MAKGNSGKYAIQVLQMMVDKSVDGIYIGYLSNAFQDLDIPITYYSHVITLLESTGSAVQLQRGGGTRKSKWQILNPDPDLLKQSDSLYSIRNTKVQKMNRDIESLKKSDKAILRRLDLLEKKLRGK